MAARMTRRTLGLSRERLTDLAPADLAEVVAGGDTTSTCNTGLTVCGPCDIQIEHMPLPTEHRSGC